MKTLITSAALAVLSALPALAQSQCAPTASIEASLSEQYGEAAIFFGLSGDGSTLLRVWLNEEEGGWTVTGSGADGITCIYSAGVGGEVIAPVAEPDPA